MSDILSLINDYNPITSMNESNPNKNTQSYIMTNYEISRPFTSSKSNKQLCGYIDDGYTMDSNGMCTGNLITVEGSTPSIDGTLVFTGERSINTTKQVTLLSIMNKPSYNLKSINDPLQILIMTKDNKYIFPYPYETISILSINETFGLFMSLVSLIFAIKIYNISIPLITDYELLYNASINSLYNPSKIDTTLPSYKITLQKMIMLADEPDTDPSKSLDSSKVKSWSDLSGLLKTFNQLYDHDLSNICISYSATDIKTIPDNVSYFDCRNAEKLNTNEPTNALRDEPTNALRDEPTSKPTNESNKLLNDLINESNNNSNDNTSFFMTPMGIGIIIILVLIIISIIIVNSSNKSSIQSSDNLTSSGGYYYF
jgi:hypothetical protein